jgi:hypothetical protein
MRNNGKGCILPNGVSAVDRESKNDQGVKEKQGKKSQKSI